MQTRNLTCAAFLASLLSASLVLGCASGSPPAKTAASEPASPSAAEPASPSAEGPPTLPALGPGVPAAPASCPAGAPLPASRAACPAASAELARALADSSSAADAALIPLEACTEFPVGIVRALRAERLPACADQLVEPALDPNVAELDPGLRSTLLALGVSGRLSRLVDAPPAAPKATTRQEMEQYLTGQLFPWATEQAKAIGELSRAGAKMRGYARGVVAIEAALADLRFVEMARALPLPAEMQAPDVQAEYYAALDEALEPRKDRARDAALVGLGELSALGVLDSPRLLQARQVIARVFAGNRIMALDTLLVPPAPTCAKSTPEEVIAASVESPYSLALVPSAPLTPGLTHCLLSRGLPVDLARRLSDEQAAELTPEHRSALSRAYFDLGRAYLQAAAFQRAAEFYAKAARKDAAPANDSDRLLLALSTVLSAAPASVVDLFRLGPRLPPALGETALLDDLAQTKATTAGAAAFDAAYLRELTAPDGSASHFKDVAKRYQAAQAKLKGKERTLAGDRAKAADATAKALEKKLR